MRKRFPSGKKLAKNLRMRCQWGTPPSYYLFLWTQKASNRCGICIGPGKSHESPGLSPQLVHAWHGVRVVHYFRVFTVMSLSVGGRMGETVNYFKDVVPCRSIHHQGMVPHL